MSGAGQGLVQSLAAWAGGLRFPRLLALTASLFLLDLVVPDLVPFVDEILLALASLLFATWSKSKKERREPPSDES